MSEEEKETCVSSVTTICKDLAGWQAPTISGVDGKELHDYWFARFDQEHPDFSCKTLQDRAVQLGMDCSTFVFYHCDLSPGNIMWDATTKSVGIIDWETAGFVPKEWVRTKLMRAAGMMFDRDDDGINRMEWGHRLDHGLEDEGFTFNYIYK